MEKKQVVSLVISADWHLGTTEPKRFRKELFTMLQDRLTSEEGLDMFIVAGDIFDMKEYLSSDVVKLFFQILYRLLTITRPYHTEFRFIEGTRTHDAKQLETLNIICENIIDHERIKFFHEVGSESIFGMDILYLPEEYVTDSGAYYHSFFEKHYDIIIGHGPTDLMWYMRKENEMIKQNSSATVFKADDLCQIANYCYFGHFHYNIATGPDNRFKSIGPVSRWEFDKTGPCGLYLVWYDTKTKLAFEKYLENTLAPVLPTIALSIKEDKDLESLNKLIRSKINKLKDSADKIRLIVAIDTTLKTAVMMQDFITASFGNIPNLKLLIKMTSSQDSEDELTEEKTPEDLIQERPYLYDKSMRDEARIAAFIKKKSDTNIPLENIIKVIRPKDNRIKDKEE